MSPSLYDLMDPAMSFDLRGPAGTIDPPSALAPYGRVIEWRSELQRTVAEVVDINSATGFSERLVPTDQKTIVYVAVAEGNMRHDLEFVIGRDGVAVLYSMQSRSRAGEGNPEPAAVEVPREPARTPQPLRTVRVLEVTDES